MLTTYLCFLMPAVIITIIFSLVDAVERKPNLAVKLLFRWVFTMTFIHIIFGLMYLCGAYS